MTIQRLLVSAAVLAVCTPAFAQEAPDAVVVDCTLEENQALEECLVIPVVPGAATAFLPGAAPLLGIAAAALLGAGGGGGVDPVDENPGDGDGDGNGGGGDGGNGDGGDGDGDGGGGPSTTPSTPSTN